MSIDSNRLIGFNVIVDPLRSLALESASRINEETESRLSSVTTMNMRFIRGDRHSRAPPPIPISPSFEKR